MSKKVKIIIGAFIVVIAAFIYFNNKKYSDLITIEAHFMQYACGDENDDMNVDAVNAVDFKSLVGRDIDPHVFALTYKLKDYFYENKTESFYYKFRLTGYISNDVLSGCDETTPKFWVKKIERIDGSNPKTNWDFY